MKIKKEELINLFLADIVVWIINMMILNFYNPQFIYLHEIVSAFTKRDIIVVFYTCGILSFILLSYINFICGMYVVYDVSIGKIVREVKILIGKHKFDKDCYRDIEVNYKKVDLLIISIYIFMILPIMLYLILPALVTVLVGIFILYCILQLLN